MKKLFSVLTDDLNTCMFTGSTDVERHHVFGSYNKKRSEKYGFIAPLRRDLHPNGVKACGNWKEVDEYLKRRCQTYYEEHIGTRDEFMKEFGRSYL